MGLCLPRLEFRGPVAALEQRVWMRVPDRGRSARLARSPTQGLELHWPA
jgi:hypothetical protein